MSMFDAFFNKGFKASKCKTLLKLTIPRIKLLRNRREIQIKQMRRDIAKLLETGQEATACIRVEHIIREENMMAAHEILELFCELIAVRLPIIEAQRECPLDLKEAISSVCFSAPRCADLPELLQVLVLFSSKYGKEFVDSATELRPECGVNRQLIKLLSIRAPAPEVKLNLLKEIAKEHELDWDPSAMEAEFFKSTEDLLNGPIGKLPLHKEESHVPSKSATDQDLEEPSSPVAGFDPSDFPEVPKVPAWANADSAAAAPKVASPVQASAPPEYNDGSLNHAKGIENSIHETQLGSKCETSIDAMENQQFTPISPPSASFDSAKLSSKNEADVDLQDVLAAAQAAADTAESAAAAARAAASLAHMKIAELTKRKNDALPESSCDNPFYTHENCAGNSEGVRYDDHGSLEVTNLSSDTNRSGLGSYLSGGHVEQEPTHDRHRRLNSSDDDSYFSYPNLFTSEGPNVGSGTRYFMDISSSSHDVR